MIDRLDDRTSEALEAVEKLTRDVQDGLGDLPVWQLLQLRAWLCDMRTALDRLDYAIAAALPVTELDDQIAEHESPSVCARSGGGWRRARDHRALNELLHSDNQ